MAKSCDSFDGSQMAAQAYMGRDGTADGMMPIPHGDFARFLAETGLSAYEA